MRLRSRLDNPGRSHTSPNRTFSVSSMSLGTVARTFSRAADGGVDLVVMDSLSLALVLKRRTPKQGARPVVRATEGTSLIHAIDDGHCIGCRHVAVYASAPGGDSRERAGCCAKCVAMAPRPYGSGANSRTSAGLVEPLCVILGHQPANEADQLDAKSLSVL